MRIRPLEAADLPEVARHYERVMRSGRNVSAPGLEAAFRSMFIDTPTFDAEIPSLVVEVDGRLCGFQGVQVRDVLCDGIAGRMASLGPLFIVPELRGRAIGFQLLKHALAGPQDLSVSDGSSEKARRMWELLGGKLAPAQSLEWTIALRPATTLVADRSRHASGFRRVTLSAIQPGAACFDLLTAGRWNRAVISAPARIPVLSNLSPERLWAIGESVVAPCRVRPRYSLDLAKWIFAQLSSFRVRGELLAQEARLDGKAIGWFVAYIGDDRVMRIMQVYADPKNASSVLAAVTREAMMRRLRAVRGRLDGVVSTSLGHYRPYFTYGTRVLVHARNSSISAAVLALDTSLSRIDGEWLMAIRDQKYI